MHMSCLNSSQQQAPCNCSPPHHQLENLWVRDKDSLTGKAKAIHASNAKQGFNSLVPMSRQVFCIFRMAGSPQPHSGLGRQMPSLKYSFLPPSCAQLEILFWNIPSVISGHLSCPWPLPIFHSTPAYLISMAVQRVEKALSLCKPCLAITKSYL